MTVKSNGGLNQMRTGVSFLVFVSHVISHNFLHLRLLLLLENTKGA